MEAFIALIILLGMLVIREDDMAERREIEAEQERAPRKRRRRMAC